MLLLFCWSNLLFSPLTKISHDKESFCYPGGYLLYLYGGVSMKSQIQTQKYEFSVNFAPWNIVILHIFYPKLWMTILC